MKEDQEAYQMDDYRACMIVDGCEDITEPAELYAAYQHLIDNGLAWSLQGRIGRTAMDMIRAGHCVPPPDAGRVKDFYGNIIRFPKPRVDSGSTNGEATPGQPVDREDD